MRLTLMTIAVLMPQMLWADEIANDQRCTFTTECIEQEACNPTDYSVSLRYDFDKLAGTDDDGAGRGQSSDDVTDRVMIVTHSNGAFVANAIDFSSNATIAPEIYTLVSTAEGDARLITVLPDVPMVITYHGICQGAK